MRTCKVCKSKYEPRYNSLQMTCNDIDCAIKWGKEAQKKAYKAETKRLKLAFKERNRSFWLKKTQSLFNRWIRTRDSGEPCISCGIPMMGGNAIHAGHYKSNGSTHGDMLDGVPMRFHPDNCHAQCAQCNLHKSANIAEYRPRLEQKIGVERLARLEGSKEKHKITIEELKRLINGYKADLKPKAEVNFETKGRG